jgi:hypothetical protein
MSGAISATSNPFYDDFFRSPGFFHQQENLLAGQISHNEESTKESNQRNKELFDIEDRLT